MRPRRDPPAAPMLSRRALASRLAAAAATLGLGPRAAAAQAPAAPALDPELRDAALRGLALADHRGDPVHAAAARAAMDRLQQADPEGALLLRLYRKLDVRPAAYYREDMPQAAAADLALLHAAMRACRPVAFGYADLAGNETQRTALPLALVHPPQGVKLLAWCEKAQDYRQFFVRAMQGLATGSGDFRRDRLALLQGLAAKEGA